MRFCVVSARSAALEGHGALEAGSEHPGQLRRDLAQVTRLVTDLAVSGDGPLHSEDGSPGDVRVDLLSIEPGPGCDHVGNLVKMRADPLLVEAAERTKGSNATGLIVEGATDDEDHR